MKLTDLKTTAYNGLESDIKDARKLELPEAASPIFEPFIIYRKGPGERGIRHHPDDPIWSVNMKRAIASVFQVNRDFSTTYSNNATEWSIYGKCTANYEVEEQDYIAVLTKTLGECEEEPDYMWGNLLTEPVLPNMHKVLTKNVVRQYTINRTEEPERQLIRVESFANVTAQTMPRDQRTHHIIQKQVFTFLNSSRIDHVMDYNLTVFKNITYENTYDSLQKIEDRRKLLEDLHSYFELYTEHLNSDYLKDFNSSDYLILDQVFNTIKDISQDTSDLSNSLQSFLNDPKFLELFTYFLPYIGTEQSLKYIKEIIKNHTLTTEEATNILATFPTYAHFENEEILEELEILMNLDTTHSTLVKNTGILNFATTVANCYIANKCSQETLMKYVNQYKDFYKGAKSYDLRMLYVLGMSNMAVGLNADFILTLLTNPNEYSQLRSLAFYAFKDVLIAEPNTVFHTMWLILSNHSESLEVKVAALDLILALPLSNDQFHIILETLDQNLLDPKEQHLWNYFYTATLHLENITDKMRKPESYKTLFTGKYELELYGMENNFGAKFETRMVANPKTNYIDTVQFSVNRFAMTFTLARYSIYLKIEGVFDSWLEEILNERINADTAIPELLKIIQKINFKLKDFPNVHIDVVFFNNDRAVTAFHLQNDDCQDVFTDFLRYYMIENGITYPVWHLTNIPSDLGTPITFTNKVTNFFKMSNDLEDEHDDSETTELEFNLRYEWLSNIELACRNPINNLSIAASDSKIFKTQVIVPYVMNTTGNYIKWQNDNITFNAVVDIVPGTSVTNEEQLKNYCSHCQAYYHVQPIIGQKIEQPIEFLGIKLHRTDLYTDVNNNLKDNLKKIEESRKISAQISELIPPYYLLFDVWYHQIHLPPVDSFSMSLTNVPLYSEPTESLLELDFLECLLDPGIPTLSGSSLEGSLIYTNRKINDGSVLRYWNITSNFQYKPTRAETGKLENYFRVLIDNIYVDGQKDKICLNTTISYPVPRKELYSLLASKLSEARITYSECNDSCTTDDILEEYSILASVTDEQINYVNSMPEFYICKKQSAGLKFTPPTRECMKVSHILSNYRSYDFRRIVNVKKDNKNIRVRTSNTSLAFGMEDKDLAVVTNGQEKHYNIEKDEYLMELFLLDSIDRWFYDEHVKWGLQSNCFITPNDIKTFADEDIIDYDNKVNVKLVGFVECINSTRSGLVFTRLDDKYLAFKLWTENSVITATRSNNKMRARLNGKLFKAGEIVESNALKVLNFGNEAIYLFDDLIAVYYNTEYIMIKIYSNYNRYVCGLCGSQDN